MAKPTSPPPIPRSIWALGFVSLLMDISTEMVQSLFPIFLVTVLGSSMTTVGLIEGLANAALHLTKMCSGTLSDYFNRRKIFTIIGYGTGALIKPLFPLADSITAAFSARFIDRISKGIRGAPRDALLGDLAPPAIRGACFGARKSLDSVGSFLGPAFAMLALMSFSGDIRSIFWIAVIPAFLSVIVLVMGVKEPDPQPTPESEHSFAPGNIRHIGKAYWHLIAAVGLMTLARFSDAFLILKAQEVGLPLVWLPLIMVITNIAFAFSAYPAGIYSDNGKNRYSVVLAGLIVLIIADLTLAFASDLRFLAIGILLWGLHLGLTEGLLSAMVTDVTPPRIRGTAYGIFNATSGLALMIASLIAGMLWDHFGSTTTFLVSAAFSSMALAWISYTRLINR